jgi:hypothetical protein
MHVLEGLYFDIKKPASLLEKKNVSLLYEKLKKIDLRFIGAFDPFEVNETIVKPIDVQKKSWLGIYNLNKMEIQSCLKQKFYLSSYKGVNYNKHLYAPANVKNDLLEFIYVQALSANTIKPSGRSRYVYGFYDDKTGPELTTAHIETVSGLISQVRKDLSKNGKAAVAVQCVSSVIDNGKDVFTNHSQNLEKVVCTTRATRLECTDTTYLLNRSIVQNIKYKPGTIRLLKVYELQLYDKNGGKLSLKKGTTTFGLSTSTWDYHEAALIVFQDTKTGKVYFSVIDEFFYSVPVTLSKWLTDLIPDVTDIKFRLFPYVRVKEREEKYMSEVEAAAYVKEHEKNRDAY